MSSTQSKSANVPSKRTGKVSSGAQTPYLEMNLPFLVHRYHDMASSLPGVDIHYAVKCNPAPAILRVLHGEGARFEIASTAELDTLQALGVDPEDVLFSNPVKPPAYIRAASHAGVERFAFDSFDELMKIQKHAPGSKVYVRLSVPLLGSKVPSEGKFGVESDLAVELLTEAQRIGLTAYGTAFHVGSQMTDPMAWDVAIQRCGLVMRQLETARVRVETLNVGGGFPAPYGEPVTPLSEISKTIMSAVDQYLPYEVKLLAEPGRALVAEAGVFVTTIIGIAERSGRKWLHLDVGAFNGMMESLESRNTLRYPMVDELNNSERAVYNITGPSCDSQDTILFDVELSAGLKTGDRLFIKTAGAYTTSYASAFNGFEIPGIVPVT